MCGLVNEYIKLFVADVQKLHVLFVIELGRYENESLVYNIQAMLISSLSS